MTSEGREIKNKTEILALLKALFLPQKLSIMHCLGHQKGHSPEAKGNRLADAAAKEAALKTISTSRAFPLTDLGDTQPSRCPLPYSQEDIDLLKKMGATYDPKEQHWVFKGKTVVPMRHTYELIKYLHKLTHLGPKKMKTLLK